MPRDAKEKNVTQLPERIPFVATVNGVQIKESDGQPVIRATFTTELDGDVLRALAQCTGTEVRLSLTEIQLPLFGGGDDENGEGETEATEG